MCGLVWRNCQRTVIHGSTGRELREGLSMDKAFLACNSFSVEKGASTPDIIHADAKKQVMSIAAKVILLFDSSKMRCTLFALFVLLEAVDTIATDAIGAEDRSRLEETGNDVLLAEFEEAASSAGSGG
jgi:DeoR family fructose operon transcriptional repressor